MTNYIVRFLGLVMIVAALALLYPEVTGGVSYVSKTGTELTSSDALYWMNVACHFMFLVLGVILLVRGNGPLRRG